MGVLCLLLFSFYYWLLSIVPFFLYSSSGSANQSIKVLNMNGDVLSNIRYHDGFIGQRIGPLSCLAFHPYWVCVTNAQFCFIVIQYFAMPSQVEETDFA